MGVGFAVLPLGLSLLASVVTLLHLLTPNVKLPLGGLPRFNLVNILLSRSRPALYFWLVLSGSQGAALTAMFVSWRWLA